MRAALRRARITPSCEVVGKGLPTCIERIRLQLRDGRNVFVVRLNALSDPKLLRQLGKNGPIPIEITLPRKLHLREWKGKDYGLTKSVKTMLDPFGAVFLEIVP